MLLTEVVGHHVIVVFVGQQRSPRKKENIVVPRRQSLISEENYLSIVLMVGRTFSLAERETKKEKGTNQRQIVKYAIT